MTDYTWVSVTTQYPFQYLRLLTLDSTIIPRPDLMGLVCCPNHYNNRSPSSKIPKDIMFKAFNYIPRKKDPQVLALTDTVVSLSVCLLRLDSPDFNTTRSRVLGQGYHIKIIL